MKLSTTEEYGLRCLIQVARRSPHDGAGLACIKDVAEAEGLSPDYVAKLLGLLRRAELIDSERGAAGGYRLSKPASSIAVAEVLLALDSPFFGEAFCDGHRGKADACVHKGRGCTLTPLWEAVDRALDAALRGVSVADLLAEPAPPRLSQEALHG